MPLAYPWSINGIVNYNYLLEQDARGKPATGLSSTIDPERAYGLDLDSIRGWQELKIAGIVIETPLPGGRYSHYCYDTSGQAHNGRNTIAAQIHAAILTRPQRRLALWLLEEADENGYTMYTPSQMTHILLGKEGEPGRTYGDTRPITNALEALCRAGILAYTWTAGMGWAQDISIAFMQWPRPAVVHQSQQESL